MGTEVMKNGNANVANNEEGRETLYLLGGVALVVFGTGLILSNPAVRRYLGGAGLGDIAGMAMPDIERYLKLRSM